MLSTVGKQKNQRSLLWKLAANDTFAHLALGVCLPALLDADKWICSVIFHLLTAEEVVIPAAYLEVSKHGLIHSRSCCVGSSRWAD